MWTAGNAFLWMSRYRYSCETLMSAAASGTEYVGTPAPVARCARPEHLRRLPPCSARGSGSYRSVVHRMTEVADAVVVCHGGQGTAWATTRHRSFSCPRAGPRGSARRDTRRLARSARTTRLPDPHSCRTSCVPCIRWRGWRVGAGVVASPAEALGAAPELRHSQGHTQAGLARSRWAATRGRRSRTSSPGTSRRLGSSGSAPTNSSTPAGCCSRSLTPSSRRGSGATDVAVRRSFEPPRRPSLKLWIPATRSLRRCCRGSAPRRRRRFRQQRARPCSGCSTWPGRPPRENAGTSDRRRRGRPPHDPHPRRSTTRWAAVRHCR